MLWERWALLGGGLLGLLASCSGDPEPPVNLNLAGASGSGAVGGSASGAGRTGAPNGAAGASSSAGTTVGGVSAGGRSQAGSGGTSGNELSGGQGGRTNDAGESGTGGTDGGDAAAGAAGATSGESCPATGSSCVNGLVCSEYGCINPWAMPNTAELGLQNSRSYDLTKNGVVVDRVTGLMWQAAANDTPLLSTEAATLCGGLELAGYDDWRVPTRIELITIVEYGAASPALDTSAFAATEPGAWFMSASPAQPYSWLVDFALGKTSQLAATRGLVRCVRSTVNAVPPATRFTVSADGTVYDRRTRLTWQREIAKQSSVPTWAFQYTGAQSYCAALDLAGKGYRLPTMNELLTVIDDSKQNPALDDVTFPTDFGTTLVSSTPFVTDAANVWYATLVYGMAGNAGKSNNFVVRCVR
jgi:hypothetical protein